MTRETWIWIAGGLGAGALFAGCTACTSEVPSVDGRGEAVVSGAGFTTFDSERDGCHDSPNGINCNNYDSKGDVFTSGGPGPSGLSDGDYYFAVLAPGYQRSGFMDGAEGNLSDTVAGGTSGDEGIGDTIADRTFTVRDHEIVTYDGPHEQGTSPNGRAILRLYPFDDTPNEGGVYILAMCRVGATAPSECKFDAFRVRPGGTVEFPVARGMKYYDANANGAFDEGEVGIAGWPIDYENEVAETVSTGAGGRFELTLVAGSYTFAERAAASPWMQTGNLVDQTVVTGGASAELVEHAYSVALVDGGTVDGLYFGNLCVGAGGGRTLGFWSNKNGQRLVSADDLDALAALHLVEDDGSAFDPTSYAPLRTWLLSANATNMARMLSAQLAAMVLNVREGLVDADALVLATGTTSANPAGFATVGDLITEADDQLAAHPLTISIGEGRAAQEALKDALDAANENRSFVQPGPEHCPAPTW